jgi:Zn-dependent protease with chaperone function
MSDIALMDEPEPSAPPAAPQSDYFDGTSSRRRPVMLSLGDQLDIRDGETTLACWPYADIRRADGPADRLRLSCVSAPALARLEVRDKAVAEQLRARCTQLDRDSAGRHGVVAIVGWSLAAIVSLIAVALFGVPLIADRVTPLLPQAFERRLGDVADQQVKALFGSKVCDRPGGQAAFAVLVDKLRVSGGLDRDVVPAVLSSKIPNAIALPGGRVYLFSALLDKADNPDEIAGVLAHELGHVAHRDSLRQLIRDGGTSFLVGMLFGDVTGSGALIFASRTLITSSYSRDTERAADSFSIATMHGLGRPVKPMGELLFRVTGAQSGSGIDIFASHPLTEDRLARMSAEDVPPRSEPLLSAEQWSALKTICE